MLRLRRGETLVIDGASGAVGTFAVQLATQRGASGMGGLADLVAAVGATERVVTLADPEAFAVGAVFLGANEPDSAEEPAPLEVLIEQVADGKLLSLPVTTYPLKGAAAAHRDAEANRLNGKAVLIP